MTEDEHGFLAEQFEEDRTHLRAMAYRMPVDSGEMAFFEALTNERRCDPVSAPDLEHPVMRPDIQLLDDRSQSLAHDTASRSNGSTLIMVASYPPSGHSQRPEVVLRSSPNLPLNLAALQPSHGETRTSLAVVMRSPC